MGTGLRSLVQIDSDKKVYAAEGDDFYPTKASGPATEEQYTSQTSAKWGGTSDCGAHLSDDLNEYFKSCMSSNKQSNDEVNKPCGGSEREDNFLFNLM